MWRDHAAVGPDAPSPLADTGDPARSAVEILAEALREDSGTAIDVHWKADDPPAPAPAARLVRACEELLAVARTVDDGVIEVHQDGDGRLHRSASHGTRRSCCRLTSSAALEAAGSPPTVDETAVELRVAIPREALPPAHGFAWHCRVTQVQRPPSEVGEGPRCAAGRRQRVCAVTGRASCSRRTAPRPRRPVPTARSANSTRTLVEVNGAWILILLAVPIAITLCAALSARPPGRS